MIADVLIDTNILVYAYQPQAGIKHELSIKTVDYWIRIKRAAVSAQSLSEFVVVAKRRLVPLLLAGELIQSVDNLMRALIVLPVTDFVVREAIRGMETHQFSY